MEKSLKRLQIIRFENESGTGIFRHKNSEIYRNEIANKTYERHGDGRFPCPWNDKLVDNKEEYLDIDLEGKQWFCSYKTIEQFQGWIKPDEVEYFTTQGFRIYMLEVTEFQIGMNQVLFTRNSIINVEDITNLFLK